MSILIDVRLLSRGGFSGIHEYTRQIVEHLIELDQENRYQLFYSGFNKNPLPESWLGRKNVSIIDWKMPNKLLDLGSRTNIFKIEKFIKTNLIFSPHFNILRTNLPRVITFHDLSFIHHPYFFNFRQRLWHWLQDYQKQAKEAARIIADSEFTKSDLMNAFKIPEEKITVIYPGVNPEFKKLKPEDAGLKNFREKYKLDYPFVLYLGTLEPRKNIPAIIRTFSSIKTNPEFKNLKLILAGQPGWLYSDTLKEARNSPFKKGIVFWGKVENQDRIFLYNLCRVFVYPSFFEGFGFPPLEAQGCGAPVIVSNRTSLAETMTGSALLTDPWRIDEFSEKLKSILSDNTLRDNLINQGFQNAKRFSWNQTAKKTIELFKTL